MGPIDEEIALEELNSEGCPSDQEPEIIRKITEKCLNNQRNIIDGEINSNIKRSSQLDVIFREFRAASEIWEEGINSLLEDSMFELGEFLPKFDEITKPNTDKVKNASSNESAHLFLVIFVGLVNVKNLKIKSEKWKTKGGITINTLTKAAITVFTECMNRIRIDLSSIVELKRELKNSIWYCERLWRKRGYTGDEGIAAYHKQMEAAATLLVDNLLAALLRDQVSGRNSLIAAMLSDEPEDQLEAAWKGVDRRSSLKTCSQDWEGDIDAIRISTSLLYIIPRTISRSRSREMGDLDIRSTINVSSLLLCRSVVQHCLNLGHSTGEVFVRVLILRNIAECLNVMIRRTRRHGLYEEIQWKKEVYNNQMTAWLQNLEDKEGLERLLLEMYRKRCLRSIRLALNLRSIDVLLFDWERDAIKALVEVDSDFLAHLDRVSYPMCDLGCNWKRVLKPMGVAMRNCALDTCIKSVARTVSNFESLRAMNFQLFCIALYPVLYLLDVVSDVFVAKSHFDNSDFYYFSLTVLFIFCPLLAEITNKFVWKYVAGDKKLTWSDLLFPESLTLLPRSLKSILFAVKSRQHYDKDLEKFYSELLYLRFEKEFKGAKRPKWINSPNLIQALCYSRMIQNELYVFDWKMMECLNESAPQLLLQLYIVYQDLFLHEHIDIICWVGIITSLVSLSWTLHLSHYNMHYEELKNNFGVGERIMDFFSHFLMICSRFLAVSLIACMEPYMFILFATVYLTVLFLYLIFCSRWKKVYRLLLKNRRMLFWPVHRLFVTPYLLRIWRIDNEDDVLFHLETIVMAVCWSLLSPPMHAGEWLRWILLTVIISIDLLCLPALGWANNKVHMPARNCKGGKWNLQMIAKVAQLEYDNSN